MSFQIGSKYQASRRQDPMFQRALESIRHALGGYEPVAVTLRNGRRHRTRFDARLAEISRSR